MVKDVKVTSILGDQKVTYKEAGRRSFFGLKGFNKVFKHVREGNLR